ncbi:MAG: hypothetical protein CK424_07080 [Legionella sp.]|nr:MAG: hypothetical protein CK424_07080 [Legionella sp.]
MNRYFTPIAENELKKDLFQHPGAYVVKPFASYQEFGWELGNIVVSPCKYLVLTVATLLESLAAVGRACYFYRWLYELSKENYADGQRAAYIGLKTLGVFVLSLLHTLVVLCRLISTVFSVLSTLCRSEPPVAPQAPLRDRLELITHAMERYESFMTEAGDDKRAISRNIREYYSEASELSKRLDASKKHSDVSIKGITYFQSEKSQSSKESCSTHSELLAAYHELVKTYPKGEFENWTTNEEMRRITVALVEEAHSNYEEHHQKVLEVARELLGDLDATVRLAGNRIANVVENRLN